MNLLQKIKLIKKDYFLFVIEMFVILAASMAVKDVWYKICIAAIGLCFNFLVCIGNKYGFIVGVLYAVTYGVMSYTEDVYATAVLMFLIQLPCAVISFVGWNKNQAKSLDGLKLLTKKQSSGICISIAVLYVVVAAVLQYAGGSGWYFDAFFFTVNVFCCILLFRYYRVAYLIMLLSGLSGTALWLYQYVKYGDGLSVFLLNFFVFVNSGISVWKQYRSKK